MARIVGPSIAGIGIPTIGIGWCFVLDAASFVAAVGAAALVTGLVCLAVLHRWIRGARAVATA